MENLEVLDVTFVQALHVREGARLVVQPTRRGVISWNTRAQEGRIRFRLLRAHEPASPWFDYAQWTQSGRKSFSVESDKHGLVVEVDAIVAHDPFDGIDVRAEGVDFALLAFAAPSPAHASSPYGGGANVLDVPKRSQYVVDGERGWCSPASLSMVNAFHGVDVSVEATARAVLDRAYNGTGNWAFNVAFSGSLGLRAAVMYLRNLDDVQRLVERNLPVILSYSWSEGELPDAPLSHSDGHLAVLCGFTGSGDCVFNDPAAPAIRVVYPRAAIERIWQRNDGLAYVIAP